MSNKKIYVSSIKILNDKKINEGGNVRDYAFIKWMNDYRPNYRCILLTKNKLKNIIKIFYILFLTKNKTLVFQYPGIGIPIFSNKILGRLISDIYLYLLKHASDRNKIIFDISDLKYEQAIDLELVKNNIDRIKNFEEKLFILDIKFIFASYSMKNYACKKYNIKEINTDVCINGGNQNNCKENLKFDKYLDKNKIVYVYAGTLDKGRCIEKMIMEFPNNDKVMLILLGTRGKWINYKKLNNNIKYIGSLNESEAHNIVSKCDIGLIPYDENRLYYNIAYPTKLSFYITAGIPFLSTNVKEVNMINRKYNIGFISKINEWNSSIKKLTKEEIEIKKSNIDIIKRKFYWNKIFNENKFIK